MKITEIKFTGGNIYKCSHNGENYHMERGNLFNTKNNCNIYFEIPLEIIAKSDFTEVVDWSKVPVDAKIRVRYRADDTPSNRHFAKYENGVVWAWGNGRTSFSVESKFDITAWQYAELVE